MQLTFDNTGPFIFVCIDEIVHDCVELAADAEFIFQNNFSKFLSQERRQSAGKPMR
jgi:hypothetical protein